MLLKEKNYGREKIRGEKAERIPPAIRINPVAGIILSAGCAMIAANSDIGGGEFPLCVSLAASLNPLYSAAALAGSIASLFLREAVFSNITEIIAIAALVFIKVFMNSVAGKKISPAAGGILAGTVFFVCGTAVAFSTRLRAALFIALFFRGVLCGVTAYFFRISGDGYIKTGKLDLSGDKGIPAAVSYILAAAALFAFNFGPFNAGRLCGAVVILIFAYRMGVPGGAEAGVLTALGAALAAQGMTDGRSVILIACAGLMAGTFAKGGVLTAGISFVLSNSALCLIAGAPSDTVNFIADISAASVIFCLLPADIYSRIIRAKDISRGNLSGYFSDKLSGAARALGEARGITLKTADAFDRRKSRLHQKTGPRETALEQLGAAMDIFEHLGRETAEFGVIDSGLSEKANEILAGTKAKISSASAAYDPDGRLFIECFYEGALGVSAEEISEKLSVISNRELIQRPLREDAAGASGKSSLVWREPSLFAVESGFAGKSGGPEASGDCGLNFEDGFGNAYFILSDGMGTGPRAAVESGMAVSLASRLLKAGVGMKGAVKLINSLLLTKSEDEIFATVDLMRINAFSGKTDIIKLGAAATHIIRNGGDAERIESRSTPAGILSSVDFERKTLRLCDGDVAVMATDGIPDSVFPYIKKLVKDPDMNCGEAAEKIVAEAEKSGAGFQDDKSVFVIRLKKLK